MATVGVANGLTCECGAPLTGRQRSVCGHCRKFDKHRHRTRAKPQIIVSVDLEGRQDENQIMHIVSASYGREDGSCDSLSVHSVDGNYSLTGQEVLQWLIQELSGPYCDSDGTEWKQTLTAFHFNWDQSVIAKDFNANLSLVHGARSRIRNLLCNTEHDHNIAKCRKIPRNDTAIIQQVITDGGESGLLAYDSVSQIGLACTPKRRLYAEYRPNGDRFDDNQRIDIHDTGTAFVGSLLEVIDHWNPELSQAQHEIIEWGKQARKDGFLHGTIEQIEAYSEAECVAHARCVRKLLDTVRVSTGIIIKPHQLFGSGSIASAAFKFHGVPTRKDTHSDEEPFMGMALDDIARLTYFGGLIEGPVLGWVNGPIDESDLNSAYPSKAIHLPCMRAGHGHWIRRENIISHRDIRAAKDTIGHVLCTWDVRTKSTPPFVVRTVTGLVRQPLSAVRIWVSMPEYLAAYERFGDDIVAEAAVWWQPECDCEKPLAWLEKFYNARLAIKEQMKTVPIDSVEWNLLNVQQSIIKLIINSVYGKMAQQRPVLGRYTNLHNAGYITGATRATVRCESWEQEDRGGTIVYTHTDSVLSHGGSPIDGGTALGAWSLEKCMPSLLVVQPGLAIGIEGGKIATRGCSKSDFRTAVDDWLKVVDFTDHPKNWPPIEVKRKMMISRRMAIARGKPEIAGSFRSQPLTIRFHGGKRDLDEATPLPGNPTAWAVPPNLFEPWAATLSDLKAYHSELDARIKEGHYDHVPGEITFDDIDDSELDEKAEFVW
jgi:hypothetical protein